MAVQVRRMETAEAAGMAAMLPAHRQRVANMLSRMNGDMRNMKMSADARWTARADSVRQDLVRMPEMTPQQLKSVAAAHAGRVAGLIRLHRQMMGAMGQ